MSIQRKTLACLLFPFTMWYAIGVAVRNLLWDTGVRKQQSPHVTTIGVGNLATGGTGKTPMVEYLLRLFGPDMHVAMLSRGYGRGTKGFIVADPANAEVDTLGDEPAMIARKFPNVTTAVSENRLFGISNLLSLNDPPSLVVLDDVFQHRWIKPTVNILLTEYHRPYFSDRILPYGNLREFRSAHSRANIIIVTKSPQEIQPLDRRNYIARLGLKAHQRVFFAHIEYQQPLPLWHGVDTLDLSVPHNLLLVTGIASPRPLLNHLKKTHTVTHLPFPDHHQFTQADIQTIVDTFAAIPQDQPRAIITTEKDAIRLLSSPDAEPLSTLPLFQLPMRMEFNSANGETFDAALTTIVRENISFLQRLAGSPYFQSDGEE